MVFYFCYDYILQLLMFIEIYLIPFYMVWFAEALVIIFEFNENMGVVTSNHTLFHDVAPGAPLVKCLRNHPCV